MNEKATGPFSQTYTDDVVPDSLMDDFRGRPLLTILIFTIVIHVVIVTVSSVPYLKSLVLGANDATLSQEERLELAVKEATSSLRDIAKKHKVKPQDLSDRFTSGAKAPTSKAAPKSADPANGTDPTTPKEPQSPIEAKINEKADGPEQPELLPEDEDDLF